MSTLTQEERKQKRKKSKAGWILEQSVKSSGRIPESSILRCRWILTWKDAENNTHLGVEGRQSTNRKAKARLVNLRIPRSGAKQSRERQSDPFQAVQKFGIAVMCVQQMGNWKF